MKQDPTSQLIMGRDLEPGQAAIWYLYHSGWAVKTRNQFLIFDYTEPSERPAKRSLDSGSIDPAEIRGQNVTVFVSHGHADHFDTSILEWRTVIKSIRYVWGWEGAGSAEDVHFEPERKTATSDGLEILNIHHDFDGIPESAFLVNVDGLTILHAGDHGHSRGLENPVFNDNLLFLADKAPQLDLLFTPTFGGEIDAIGALKPRVVFPMHDGGNERRYAKFVQKVKSLGLALDKRADVHGADNSEEMLSVLHAKLEPRHHHRIRQGDLVNMGLGKHFDLIIAPFRVISHIIDIEDQIKALNTVYDHLAPGGLFVFDLYVPNLRLLLDGLPPTTDFDGEYAPGRRLKRTVTATSDLITQTTSVTMAFTWDEDGRRFDREWSFPMRFFSRYELEHLIARSKLKLKAICGDFAESPLDASSREFLVHCVRE